MKSVKCFYSFTVLVVLICITKRVITETVKCPRYCTCYLNVTDYKRSVVCVSRRLDNIDLTVPKRVQTLDLSNNSISVLEDRGFQVKIFILNNAMVHLDLVHILCTDLNFFSVLFVQSMYRDLTYNVYTLFTSKIMLSSFESSF